MFFHKKERPLADELTEARNNLRRELEILRGAPQIKVPPGANNRALIETLEGELREIEDALANLEKDNPS